MEKRKRSTVILTALVLAISLSASCITLYAYTTADFSDATTAAYEAELDRLRAEQSSIESELYYIRQNQSNAEEYAEYLNKQISLTEDKVKLTETLLSALAASISDKEARIAADSARIDEIYTNLLTRIRISYEEGKLSYLEMLLDASGLRDFLSRAERVGSLLDYDIRLKRKYETSKAKLQEDKVKLDETYASQILYSAELTSDISKLDAAIKDNESYLTSLDSSESAALSEYYRQLEEAEKLNAELEEYILEQIKKTQAEYVGGQFAWPANGATNYVVTCPFGWRTYEIYGITTSDYHHGIDLRAYIGTEVYAANAGEVLISTYSATYGYYVLIDHGGGYSTLYAHGSQLCVSAGEHVERGQLILMSGNTGYSNGPHLHFEIRLNGERIDPLSGNLLSTPVNMVILDY